MKTPSYLVRNRFGTYYFRLSIPLKFHGIIADKAKEFRRSLGTSQRREALMLARVWWVRLQAVLLDFDQMAKESNKDKQELQDWFQERLLKGEAKVIAEKQLRERKKKEKLNGFIKEFGGDPNIQSSNGTQIVEVDSPLLSEVVKEYVKAKERENKWTSPKTKPANLKTFALFQQIVGDIPFIAIKRKNCELFVETLKKLPPNISKKKQYKGKSIREIAADNSLKPMSSQTINHNVERLSSLFKWAALNDLTDKNYASNLSIQINKGDVKDVRPFESDELKRIFFSDEYLGRSQNRKRTPSRFWVPLIAAFTGARLNEICQLHVSDIVEKKGVLFFWINDETDDKRVKRAASRRWVPIHSTLIKLGFCDFVELQKAAKETRLFPELKKTSDGYGRAISGWFAKYCDRIGITKSDTNFHSFRHTVSNILKQKRVDRGIRKELIGHERDDLTDDNYANLYEPDIAKEAIENIDYEIDFTPLGDTVVNPWGRT